MSTLVTLPRSSFSALSVGTLKQILFEARVRVPPGVVEKEELVERVWALVEEEKRKDSEDIHDVGSEMYEDDIGSIEELDRDEQEIVETADPESEAHVDVAHEHTQENDHYRATTAGGRVEGDRGMTHERHQGMGFNSPSSRSPTPQRSVSPLKPSTSPLRSASKSKPRPQPNSTSSGLCVVCQDEEATIAIVDCGYVVDDLFHYIFKLTILFAATSPCAGNALTSFFPVLENAPYVARGLSRRPGYLGYIRHDAPCTWSSNVR